MKRRRLHGRHRPSRDAERLARLAQGLADSGSRIEDAWWEQEMTLLIDKLLRAGDDETLNQALDKLHESGSRGYDELADLIEAGCEIVHDADHAALLIALPILAWSRYTIPARELPAPTRDALRAQLGAHVLSADAEVCFADHLYSPDQLPQGYVETRAFTDALAAAAASGEDLHVDARQLPESQPFVSDVRYVMACVRTPRGRPLFRWNEPDGTREAALDAWRAQGAPSLRALLPGCSIEVLLPDAYFAAWRQADRETRPFALRAAVAYLQTLFGAQARQIRAVAAPYYDRWLEEWRVGFGMAGNDQVVHGVTWPLLGDDDEHSDIGGEIEALLKDAGVGELRILDTRMPLEYCDDCGAPLFPNADGENVHTEMPEDMQGTPAQLH